MYCSTVVQGVKFFMHGSSPTRHSLQVSLAPLWTLMMNFLCLLDLQKILLLEVMATLPERRIIL